MSVLRPVGSSSPVLSINSDVSKPSIYQLLESKAPIEEIQAVLEAVPTLDRFHFINQRNDLKMTPLYEAAVCGRADVVRLFLEFGAEINAKNGALTMTALHVAASKGHDAVVALLIEKGADLEVAVDTDHVRALRFATQENKTACMKLLLDARAQINAPGGGSQSTALLIAVKYGLDSAASVLLDYGADVNIENEDGDSPFVIAVTKNQIEFVKRMIAMSAKIDSLHKKLGGSALHMAAMKGHHDMMSLLLDRGANIEIRSHDGCTPLATAIGYDQWVAAKVLLERGADIQAHPKIVEACFKNQDVAHLVIERIKVELEKAWTTLKGKTTLDFDAHTKLISRAALNLKSLDVADSYYPQLLQAITPYDVERYVIFETSLPQALESRLKELENGFKEDADEGAIRKYQAEVDALKKSTVALNKAIVDFLSVTCEATQIPRHSAKFQFAKTLQRIDSLLIKCSTQLTKLKNASRGLKEVEAEFDDKDIFQLLTTFKGGVGSEHMKPDASFINFFGCEVQDFYTCGLCSGLDLRAIGVDLRLSHLLDEKDSKDAVSKVIQEKLALFESLKKAGRTDERIDEIITRLKKTEPSQPSELKDLEITMGQTLLRIFFSQGVEKIGKAIGDKALSEMKATVLDLINLR